MTDTTTTTPTGRPSRPRLGDVPYPERRRLLAAQRRIDAGKAAAEERAALMAALYDGGYSYGAIAKVLGVQHEVVRKAILSRTAAGYPHRR